MALWEANARSRPAAAHLVASVRGKLALLRASLTWRHGVFALTLAVYVALTIMIVVGSPLDTLDRNIVALNLHGRWPAGKRFVLDYVMMGQRAPSTAVLLPWFAWVAYRRRSFTPLIRLGTALLILNFSVGFIKIITGRYGPLKTSNAHLVLAGGNIFPSGHTSNAVVLFGVVAMTVLTHRRLMTAVAAWIAITVGLGTIYLKTHWFSDVLGGWLAGALVLMVLPLCVPWVERGFDVSISAVKRLLRSDEPRLPPPEPAAVASTHSRDRTLESAARGEP